MTKLRAGTIHQWFAGFITALEATHLSPDGPSTPETAVVRPLLWAARGQNQSLRLNATLILGNVVDNTTVCYVLHHLRDPDINPNGRANMLGVTLAVASYAYEENANAIEETLKLLRVGSDMAQTQKIATDVAERVKVSSNRSRKLAVAGLEEPCAKYKYEDKVE